MKRTIDEHAARFDRTADDYDDDHSPEYRACANLVVEAARGGDAVLDLGTGTGAIALELAGEADLVVGRDVSTGMLERAREKAAERGVDVAFGEGRFRAPNVEEYRPAPRSDPKGDDGGTGGTDGESGEDGASDESARRGSAFDVVVSNFAMHHLDDREKREAIEVIAALEPRRFVLGDVMLFDEPDPEEPFYDPSVDDPSTVGHLADAMADHWVLSRVERVHDQVGVLVADRPGAVEASSGAASAGDSESDRGNDPATGGSAAGGPASDDLAIGDSASDDPTTGEESGAEDPATDGA